MEIKELLQNKIEEMKVKYNLEREEDNSNHSNGFGMYWSGFFTCLKEISQFVDTLEVKDVDLEHEVESYWKQRDITWCRDAYSMTHIRSMLSDIAKHFFELGIKSKSSYVGTPNIDDTLKEMGVDPDSKEANSFKNSYYKALDKFKAKKGE